MLSLEASQAPIRLKRDVYLYLLRDVHKRSLKIIITQAYTSAAIWQYSLFDWTLEVCYMGEIQTIRFSVINFKHRLGYCISPLIILGLIWVCKAYLLGLSAGRGIMRCVKRSLRAKRSKIVCQYSHCHYFQSQKFRWGH